MDRIRLLRIRTGLSSAKLDLAFQKFILALKFDQNQPRVPAGQANGGQWSSETSNESDLDLVPRLKPLRADYITDEYCREIYRRDLFQCKIVKISGCYAQAMVRLVACENGHPIPPLNY